FIRYQGRNCVHSFPVLLELLAGSSHALSQLHDIMRFPAPGHLAAPKAVDFLVDIACSEDTPVTDRWRPLSLLLELVGSHAEERLPVARDLEQWREEMACAADNDVEKVRAQYGIWAAEAPDEQHYHRARNRLAVVDKPEGGKILQAELACYERECARGRDLGCLR